MATRTLDGPPGTLRLYARAIAPLIPGASALPFVGGGGTEIPETELALDGVTADPARVAAYAKVCAFALRDTLPATYPHMLAFPLHMALMTSSDFPFPAIGLVHLRNRIVQHRPIAIDEAFDLRVRPTAIELHPKGRAFAIVSEARVGDELVWEDTSTMLRRGKGSGDDAAKSERPVDPPVSAEWNLPGDLGRRYGAVSGDRNPIHMHDLSARLFGFKHAIAHGMWTKARCLAALDATLPTAFAIDVEFRRPILLPATVTFGSVAEGERTRFAVRSKRSGEPHLDGDITPATAGPTA
jgi:acyl dehydratase